jgi:hypothetical protein
MDLHFVCEPVAVEDVRVLHILMTSQFADIFTIGFSILGVLGVLVQSQYLSWLEFLTMGALDCVLAMCGWECYGTRAQPMYILLGLGETLDRFIYIVNITIYWVICKHYQVERIAPGSLPSSMKEPVVLVVNKADGDEEVSINN